MHHLSERCNSFGFVPTKIFINVWIGNTVVEVVDDILVGDVGDCGADVEEASCVGAERFVSVLPAVSQIMMGARASDCSLEVVHKNSLHIGS